MQNVILTFPEVIDSAPRSHCPHSHGSSRLPSSTDFSTLRDSRLLCLLDFENLAYSMKNIHTQTFSFAGLLAQLRQVTAHVEPWAALTQPAGQTHAAQELSVAGYRVLAIEQELVLKHLHIVKKANADLDLMMLGGYLASRRRFDTVLLGTGDGDLALALARGFKRLPQRIKVVTLGVPGSVSHRLRLHHNLFDANIVVGRDLCQSQPTSRKVALAVSF